MKTVKKNKNNDVKKAVKANKKTNKNNEKYVDENDCQGGGCCFVCLLDDIFDAIDTIMIDGDMLEDMMDEFLLLDEKSVPTNDRIKIPDRIVKDCKKAVEKKPSVKSKKADVAKNANLTNDERKTILTLRKSGLPIKEIARRIHKRDSIVGAFLSGKIK